jgi:hypothetical protein
MKEMYGAILSMLIYGVITAQDVNPEHDKYHEWYQNLQNGKKQGCCSNKHCRPIPDTDLRHGISGWELLLNGVWRTVPSYAILDIPSPNGGYHACIVADEIRCVIVLPET